MVDQLKKPRFTAVAVGLLGLPGVLLDSSCCGLGVRLISRFLVSCCWCRLSTYFKLTLEVFMFTR